MIKEHIVDQGSEEWFKLRSGIITSSDITSIMAIKGLGKGAETIAKKKAWEKLMGVEESDFDTFDMKRGRELEPLAFEYTANDLANDFLDIRECGFYFNDDINSGSSPDGVISNNGGWENKAPRWEKFLGIILDENFSPEQAYFNQMQHQMLVCGFDYILHTNYILYKGLDHRHKHIVEKCEHTHELMTERIIQFNALVEMYYNRFKEIYKIK